MVLADLAKKVVYTSILLQTAVEMGMPVHKVEKSIFSTVLAMGKQAMNYFFQAQGDGDVGEKLLLEKNNEIKRLDKSTRYYQSIFGEFKLERYRYGSREGQKIACIPFDARLELPESNYGYLLQEWSQMMAVEVPFEKTAQFLEKIFPIKTPVDSLERINRMQANDVEAFRASRIIDFKKEKSVLVFSADGKGVPIRHKKDQLRIEDHKRKKGPKPDRKRMAVVGAVYSISPFVRTPEEIVEALFIDPQQSSRESVPKRPKPKNKKVVAHLTREINGKMLNATQTTFEWMMMQVKLRDPAALKSRVALMDFSVDAASVVPPCDSAQGRKHRRFLSRDAIFRRIRPSRGEARRALRSKRHSPHQDNHGRDNI